MTSTTPEPRLSVVPAASPDDGIHRDCLAGATWETFPLSVGPGIAAFAERPGPGFFDPAAPEKPWPGRVSLVRCGHDGPERFHLLRGIGFRDRETGNVVAVPAADGRYSSDLTSVPTVLTWLVPKTGQHLPAALLHDGLIGRADAPEFQSHRPVERAEADRIFREAMGQLGVSRLRRWLVWSGVTLATIWAERRTYRRYAIAMVVLFAIVAFCGVNATLDLFDLGVKLPWMGDRPMWAEIVTGGAAAATTGLLGGVAFAPKFWKAGMITTLSLALLFHVVIGVLAVRGLFWVAERLVGASTPRRWIVPVFFVGVVGITVWACVAGRG